MSWNDFHQRQHTLHMVIERARRDPDAPLTLPPGHPASAGFANTEELLAALQYKWTQQLVGRIDVALAEAENEPHHDRVQAVIDAWRRTQAANSALRALLDQHAPETGHFGPSEGKSRQAFDAERHLLAVTSGLADEQEDDATISRAGHAFTCLMRATAPERPACGKGAIAQLGRLTPSR